MKPIYPKACLKLILCMGMLFFGSCTSSKTAYQKEYRRVWKEMIQSEAWKNSLKIAPKTTASKQETFYASSSDTPLDNDAMTYEVRNDIGFNKKYNSLVARAYFKIISEAEKADTRLRNQYQSLQGQQAYNGKNDKAAKQDFALVSKRYEAHKKMLKGLKSWKIFSEHRSRDLDLFKEENEKEVHRMYQLKKTDDAMIGFLIYKLADLYHFEQ